MNTISAIGVTMDCPDPEVAATFWETFLNYRRRPSKPDQPYVTIERPQTSDGLAHVTFQRVPEPKTTKARVHLDLFVDHAQPIVDAMLEAGATAVRTIPAGAWTTRVLQDPAGNELCLIGPD
jgi:hypothetical protein